LCPSEKKLESAKCCLTCQASQGFLSGFFLQPWSSKIPVYRVGTEVGGHAGALARFHASSIKAMNCRTRHRLSEARRQRAEPAQHQAHAPCKAVWLTPQTTHQPASNKPWQSKTNHSRQQQRAIEGDMVLHETIGSEVLREMADRRW
jgi:hypothetical protein